MEPLRTLTQLYFGYFGRAPEPLGYDFWASVIESGMSLHAIAEDFATQPEALALYPELSNGPDTDFTTFVTSIYANLFNRSPDQAGLEFWVSVLEAGASIGGAILSIIEGAVGDDVITLENKVNLSNDWLALARVEPDFELTDTGKDASRAALEFIGDNPTDTAQAQVLVEAFFNDAPEVFLTRVLNSLDADEDTSDRIKLANVVVTDDDLGTNELSIISGNGALFELDGNELFLVAGADLTEFEDSLLSVSIAVDDSSIGSNTEDIASFGLFVEALSETTDRIEPPIVPNDPVEPITPIVPPDLRPVSSSILR